MIVNMENKSGVTLATQGKYCTENIEVVPTFEMGGSASSKLASVVDGTVTEITAEDLAGVTSIRDYAFYACTNLKSIKIPDGITKINNNAFNNCGSLTAISIPDGVSVIGSNAFRYCSKLSNINIPSSVKSLGDYTFYSCVSLTSITIPDSVTSIGNYAFSGCSSLPSIEIPDSVTTILSSAFYRCLSLTSITIPQGVTSIGNSALQIGSEENKATIAFLGTIPPTISTSTFKATQLNKIIVPAGCADAYKSATNWSNFADYIEEATE